MTFEVFPLGFREFLAFRGIEVDPFDSAAESRRTVARRHSAFAPHQGLALWLDLTTAWHGEGNGKRSRAAADVS